LCRFADRLGICRIVLLPLDEGLDASGRAEPHLMAQLADLAPPEMCAAAGFHRDNARRKLAEKLQNLYSTLLLAQDRSTSAVGSMNLKHILRQIEPDRSNLRHDRSPLWILADPPWHIDAVGGAVTSSEPIRCRRAGPE
jgi:hypothetical protein